MPSSRLHLHEKTAPVHTELSNSVGQTFRVATWNAGLAKHPDRIATALLSSRKLRNADIILLQEVESHENEEMPRAERIAKMCGFECLYFPARPAGKNGTHGLAVLSREPVCNERTIRLVAYDLIIRSRERIAVAFDVSIRGESTRIYNVHLDTRINAKDRLRQVASVLDDIAKHPCQRIVLAGDFNTMPVYWAKNIIPSGFIDQKKLVDKALAVAGFTSQTSFIGPTRRGIVRFELDSIYTRGLISASVGIDRTIRVSDHHPLWADIESVTL